MWQGGARTELDKGPQIKLRLPDRLSQWVSLRLCCLRGGAYSRDHSVRDDCRVAD